MSNEMHWMDEIDFHPEPQMIIKLGDDGDAVEGIQRLLKEIGYPIKIDGEFGPGTKRTVKLFQKQAGLVVDGRVGTKTLELLKQHPKDPKVLSQDDIEWAAGELGVEVAAVMAVNEVESRGSGFFNATHPAILYERHVMRRRLKHNGIDPTPYEKSMPGIVNRSMGGYKGGLVEFTRLEVAKGIDPTSAMESASWGAFQIMGYHWKHLGYVSIDDYVEKMHRGEREHLAAFVAFIQADPRLHNALREKDWASFARYYNGPAYAKHGYHHKMAAAFTEHHVV